MTEERPSALLTKAQRRYLRGDKVLSAAEERAIRSRIRGRLRHGIQDFTLLFEFLSDGDMETVFRDVKDDWRGREGLADMMAIFFMQAEMMGMFDELFGRGVRRAIHRMLRDDVDAIIGVRPRDEIVEIIDEEKIETAIRKFSSEGRGLADLTDAESRTLLHLFHRRGYSQSELEDLQEDLFEELDKIRHDHRGGLDSMRRDDWRRYTGITRTDETGEGEKSTEE